MGELKIFNENKKGLNLEFQKIFEEAKQNGIKYLFFVSDDKVKLHDNIKLMEQQTGILTQVCGRATVIKRLGKFRKSASRRSKRSSRRAAPRL